jgi:HEPN domain-containing protein
MAEWSLKTLRALDLKYAREGVPLHQRSFRAAQDILGPEFVIGVGGNPEIERITAAYREMIPEAHDSWPGMGIGLAAVVDQVRKVTMAVVFGQDTLTVWKALHFDSEHDWWHWCREDRDIAIGTQFAVADLLDLTYGLDDLRGGGGVDLVRWQMATSNLADAANNLPTAFSVDTVIQPICLVVELSLKAALIRNGADPNSFKGGDGHDFHKLAKRLGGETPHRDDTLVAKVIAKLPAYVGSRYDPAGLTRYDVVRLALGAQFIAASTVRRFSSRDFAGDIESSSPRPRMFGV